MTKREEAKKFVDEYCNAISTEIVGELMDNNPSDWDEVTRKSVGDLVYLFDDGEEAYIDGITDDGIEATVDGEKKEYKDGTYEIERDNVLPMWGWMWSFDNEYTNEWLEKNLDKVSECGFRIYKSVKHGYFIGLDRAGYDFYDSHWARLREAYMAG